MKKVSMLKLGAVMAAASVAPAAFAGYAASDPAQVAPKYSDASLYVPEVNLNPGGQKMVQVSISGAGQEFADGYRGFQFDLSNIPSGISIKQCSVPFNNWSEVESSYLDNGDWRVIAYTTSNPSKNTYMLLMTFEAAEDMPEGSYTVTVNDVDFSSPKGVDILCQPSTFTINVEKYMEVPIPVEELWLEPVDLTMMKDDAGYQLKATVVPYNATNPELVWSSSDETVATVSQTGFVTPVAKGQCTITVMTTDGSNLSATCAVTVLEEDEPGPEPPVNPWDPSTCKVTTSDTYFVVVSGTEVNMWAKGEGGNPEGWTYSWTKKGSSTVLGTGTDLSVMTYNVNEDPVYDIYEVAVSNSWEDELMFEATYEFTVEVWAEGSMNNTPDTDHSGWYPGGNGTFVSDLKIREGNDLGLYVQPKGGYMNEWTYLWTAPDNAELGTEQEIWTPAELYGAAANSGKEKAISNNTYYAHVTNYGPTGAPWFTQVLPTAQVAVYKRPQAPTQLLRKGEGNKEVGTSHTFVVMMTPLSNTEILDLGYTYTYGYTDQNGVMHELETTELRYTHTTEAIYWNNAYKFWAYSNWHYPDGSIVTSGLRYLDGSEDPDFDASVFSGTRGELPGTTGVGAVEADEAVTVIYTIDGKYVGTDVDGLDSGIYIVRSGKVAKKVVL